MISLNIALRSEMSDSPTKRTFLGRSGRETRGYLAASLWYSSSISLYFLETCNENVLPGFIPLQERQEQQSSSLSAVKH